jgi:hypothetical protein
VLEDGSENPQFAGLLAGLRQAYEPYHLALWNGQGQGAQSPKFALEGQEAALLMSPVKGSPLGHKAAGQKKLSREDYRGIGRIFLFDLIVRNVDRFPCAKTLGRSYLAIDAQGNAGNVMFGSGADGDSVVFSIDPAITLGSPEVPMDAYLKTVGEIVDEVCLDHCHDAHAVQLLHLWLDAPVVPLVQGAGEGAGEPAGTPPGRKRKDSVHLAVAAFGSFQGSAGKRGSLGASSDHGLGGERPPMRELMRWAAQAPAVQAALTAQLQQMRGIVAAAREQAQLRLVQEPTAWAVELRDPPAADVANETAWRGWADQALPCALRDLQSFILTTTGFAPHPDQVPWMRQGFVSALEVVSHHAAGMQAAFEHTFGGGGGGGDSSNSTVVEFGLQLLALVAKKDRQFNPKGLWHKARGKVDDLALAARKERMLSRAHSAPIPGHRRASAPAPAPPTAADQIAAGAPVADAVSRGDDEGALAETETETETES